MFFFGYFFVYSFNPPTLSTQHIPTLWVGHLLVDGVFFFFFFFEVELDQICMNKIFNSSNTAQFILLTI